jgi:hypothetical protein
MDAEREANLDRMTDTIGAHSEVVEARIGERIEGTERRELRGRDH